MPHVPGADQPVLDQPMPPVSAVEDGSASMSTTEDAGLLASVAATLAKPGLVIVTGAPGAGRTTMLRRVAAGFRGPVHLGGGLAILHTSPGLALARAVRAKLPVDDIALCAEAVRSRVRGGLLVVDDLQWADPVTLAVLPLLAAHCRVIAALRTPHRLPEEALTRLGGALFLPVPALPAEQAEALAATTAPGIDRVTVRAIVERSGGNPLAVIALARHAQASPGAEATAESGPDAQSVAHHIATALADLPRPARTAMAALGLLGRPAPTALLGPGAPTLVEAGLVTETEGLLAPVSPYVAEVASGMLSGEERAGLHRRLAELSSDDAAAARHLAAAGDDTAAHQRALVAAKAATTAGERADLLLLACGLPGVVPAPQVRQAAARIALTVGRPRAALRALGDWRDGDEALLLRAEAHVHLGDVTAAQAEITGLAEPHAAGADRIGLLAALAPRDADPETLAALVAEVNARHGAEPEHPGLRAATAAAHAHTRRPGWESALATAAATAGRAGDDLSARWSGWLLVETLVADGRLAEAAVVAERAAAACAGDLAYSWQTRFLAAELWCRALHGSGLDEVTHLAGDLIDRTLPAAAHGYAAAAAALADADTGALRSARSRLAGVPAVPPSAAAVVEWVARETAWLDNQPERAGSNGPTAAVPIVDGLARITAQWAAFDGATALAADAEPPFPPAVRATLSAWRSASAEDFTAAAGAWQDLALRERVRCLLAAGLHASTAEAATPPLLAAEELADASGLVVLAGRARRALRRHHVRRDRRGARAGDDLTDREREVLRLVAEGEPTRRIAGQLGISAETVETHIRAGMRKLGARTRTEAAARALKVIE
ncbi:LuxR C-terminal-related transcriptional regulator [Phytomonospora sp. NPDC050363]|uniref:LuxR C-terminal-related transcriptional regulator n=1 Tax=Phytomonospora sp. NPDC050363 TaxID=3155642 RepID=UPI0033C2CD96